MFNGNLWGELAAASPCSHLLSLRTAVDITSSLQLDQVTAISQHDTFVLDHTDYVFCHSIIPQRISGIPSAPPYPSNHGEHPSLSWLPYGSGCRPNQTGIVPQHGR